VVRYGAVRTLGDTELQAPVSTFGKRLFSGVNAANSLPLRRFRTRFPVERRSALTYPPRRQTVGRRWGLHGADRPAERAPIWSLFQPLFYAFLAAIDPRILDRASVILHAGCEGKTCSRFAARTTAHADRFFRRLPIPHAGHHRSDSL
jgi:hypothetical protein